jgi:glutathione S-transferase
VPFFIKPITARIANSVSSMFLDPNFKTHFAFIESQLKASPDGGPYLCGKELTGADFLMSFPLEAGPRRAGLEDQCPLIKAFVDRLHESESYQRSVKKIEGIEGSFKSSL